MTMVESRTRISCWAHGPRAPRALARVVVALVLIAVMAAVPGGCSRKKKYPQETPDDVIKSAVAMVKDKKTAQLGDLIYADSPEMRVMLNNVGKLMGHMQTLSAAAEKRFPQEIAAMKDKAAQSVADGEATSFLSQMMGQAGRGRPTSVKVGSNGVSVGNGGGGGPGGMDEKQMEDLFNRLFADPYGWLERNAARLSTLKTADDTATILLDGEMIIPGLGLPMRRDKDSKWYVALPTNMPGFSDFWPRSKDQWRILNSVVTVLDKTVVDMEKDITAGRTATLSSLGTEARKKVVLPGAIAFAAYAKEMDVRQRIDRRLKQLQTKQREWGAKKAEAGIEVPNKLYSAMNRLAGDELEPLVRKNKAPNIEKLSLSEFETMVNDWFTHAGIALRMDGDLSKDLVESELTKWDAARQKTVASAKKK